MPASLADATVSDGDSDEGEAEGFEVDGVETIRALRKLHRTVPIVAISGGGRRSGLDYLEDIHLFGASAVLEKPFEIAKFKEIIAALLGGADATPPYSGPAVL